jgi:hypothetical protein
MAQDGEVALALQPLLGVSRSCFWGLMENQVADPLIEAERYDLYISHIDR